MINWFEIPSVDIDRAVNFYNTVLGISLSREIFLDVPHGIFVEDGKSYGAVILDERVRPATEGSIVYLSAGKDFEGVVGRVESAGGKLLLPITDIGDAGYMAIILDTEGNRIGLHMPK